MDALRAFVFATAAAALVLASPHDANACGGCFHPVAEVGGSVITDHRMAFKISTTETILWDQVRYTGSPQEFAWVLPVREGARIELSRDAWLGALDASTRTVVTGPERSCGGGGGSGSGGGGCMSTTETTSDFAAGSAGHAEDAGFSSSGNVQVVSQSVIGPYQAVTIRANGDQGIVDWLLANGFAIPDATRPVVDAYTRERFDFIALRLRPGEGVQAMRPVRVVTQGADVTLPLRMVAAGVGANVGITLWVVGEGRYHTQNFPDAPIDYRRLVWDGEASRSNLSDLEREALASNDGRSWITEAAVQAQLSPTLYAAYMGQCESRPPEEVRCTEDDLPPPDGQPADAGIDGDASTDPDAGTDADPGNATTCTKWVSGCDGFDDLDVALRGLSREDVWVTRLRADLPVTALATDLRLEAAPDQTEASPVHHTDTFSDPSFDPCARTRASGASSSNGNGSGGCACRTPPTRTDLGTWTLIAATAATIRNRRGRAARGSARSGRRAAAPPA